MCVIFYITFGLDLFSSARQGSIYVIKTTIISNIVKYYYNFK